MCTTVMGIIFITVIGQCMGAKDVPAAEFYFKKLMKITVAMSAAWNILTFYFQCVRVSIRRST